MAMPNEADVFELPECDTCCSHIKKIVKIELSWLCNEEVVLCCMAPVDGCIHIVVPERQ